MLPVESYSYKLKSLRAIDHQHENGNRFDEISFRLGVAVVPEVRSIERVFCIIQCLH